MGHCLNAIVTLVTPPLSIRVSKICTASDYTALYVDEGLLYADIEGNLVKLFVSKS